MKLIKQSFQFVNQESFTLKDIYKHIEYCARISYKSQDKITDTSYEKFVNMLESRGHDRPLEFGTVHLEIDMCLRDIIIDTLTNRDMLNQLWWKETYKNGKVYVTTNYRYYLAIKKVYPDIDKYFTEEDNKYYPKRYTVHMILDRGVMDEFRTHVGLSHLAESTRYCVSGDTLLKYKNPLNHYTIKELWEDKQNKNKLSQVLIEVLNIDTGILEYSKIKIYLIMVLEKYIKLLQNQDIL